MVLFLFSHSEGRLSSGKASPSNPTKRAKMIRVEDTFGIFNTLIIFAMLGIRRLKFLFISFHRLIKIKVYKLNSFAQKFYLDFMTKFYTVIFSIYIYIIYYYGALSSGWGIPSSHSRLFSRCQMELRKPERKLSKPES